MLGRDWVRAGVPERVGARGRAKTNGAGAWGRAKTNGAGVLLVTGAGVGGQGNSRLWAVFILGLTAVAGAVAGAGATAAVAVALRLILARPAVLSGRG